MAEPIIPPRAKLFIGIITNKDELLFLAERKLAKHYGEIDFRSSKIPFSHTEYYSTMGKNLYKVFLSFRKLIKRESIVKIKLYTNRLERKLSPKGKRQINIDPGYVTLSNVYLATCKEFFHRVYLNKGVYLENEFRYMAKQFLPWEWTYPDYKKSEYIDFFHTIRQLHYTQLNE